MYVLKLRMSSNKIDQLYCGLKNKYIKQYQELCKSFFCQLYGAIRIPIGL
ncbi:hypothetical protein pb186bvf_001315 [Paramecium bursaria]